MGKLGSTEVFGYLKVNRDLEVSGELTKKGKEIPTIDGNIATATKLETARIIAISGDVNGSAGFDGSGNITITASVSDDSHNHVISNIDGLQTALDGKVDNSQVLTNVPSGAKFTDTTYSVGDGGLTEKNFTSALKSKLDGVSSGANNYTHPSTHPATIITQDASHRFATDSEKAIWNAKANAHSHPYRPDTWYPSVEDIGAEPAFNKNSAFNKNFGSTIGTISEGNHNHDSRYYTESEMDTKLASKSDTTHTHLISWDGIDGKPVSYDPIAHDHDARYYTETESDAKYVNKAGSTMTGDLTLSKDQPTLRLYDTNGDAGNYPRILFDTANNQGVMLKHTEFDGELPEGGYGLLLEKSTNNIQNTGTLLVVEGNIYADSDKKVFHQGFKPTPSEIGAATDIHNHDDKYYTETEMDTLLAQKAGAHSHPYLVTSGGVLTGNVSFTNNQTGITWDRNTDGAFIKFKNDSDADTDSYLEFGTVDNGNEFFKWTVDSVEEMSLKADGLRVVNSIYEGGTSLSSKYLGISANAVSASKLATSRNIALGGDLSGSANFDGTGNITITATVKDDSHNHVISNIDGLQSALDLKADTTYVNNEIANLVNTAPGTLDTLNELAAALGDDPNFATTISTQIGTKLDATANAVSASKLLTARTIALSGDVVGSASFDGTANTMITAVVQDDSHNHIISNVDGLQTALDGKLDGVGGTVSGNLTVSGSLISTRFVGIHDGTDDCFIEVTDDNPDHNGQTFGGEFNFYGDKAINLSLVRVGGIEVQKDALTVAGNKVYHEGNKPEALANPRTISLGGDLNGSATFDGTSDITINASVGDDTHSHVVSNIDGLQSILDSKVELSGGALTGQMVTKNSSSVASLDELTVNTAPIHVPSTTYTSGTTGYIPTISSETQLNTGYHQHLSIGHKRNSGWDEVYIAAGGNDSYPTKEWLFDVSQGYFKSPGNIYEGGTNLSSKYLGISSNATSASKLQTPRTISLTGEVTGSTTFDGSGNVSIGCTVPVKSVNGKTGAVTLSHSDVGAASSAHTHSYLPLSGGTVSGAVDLQGGLKQDGNTILNGSDTWLRTYGSTGWYSGTYGGGIYMTDTTWVKTYNDKAFYVGNTIAATGNVYAYYSDERLKTKTGVIEEAIEKVKSLEGFYYVENEVAKSLGYNNDKRQIGVSAQKVQKVLPEAVSLAPIDMETDEKTGEIKSKSGENYITVDYSKLTPLLIEAVKEQQIKIEILEKKISEVLSKISR